MFVQEEPSSLTSPQVSPPALIQEILETQQLRSHGEGPDQVPTSASADNDSITTAADPTNDYQHSTSSSEDYGANARYVYEGPLTRRRAAAPRQIRFEEPILPRESQANRISDRRNIFGEPVARSPLHISTRSAFEQEGEEPTAPRSPRIGGTGSSDGRNESRRENPDPVTHQPTVHSSVSHLFLRRTARISGDRAEHRLGFDLDFRAVPISVRLESTRPVSCVSYQPESPNVRLEIHFD